MEVIIIIGVIVVLLYLGYKLLLFVLKGLYKVLPYLLCIAVIVSAVYIINNYVSKGAINDGMISNVFYGVGQTIGLLIGLMGKTLFFAAVFAGVMFGCVVVSALFKLIKIRCVMITSMLLLFLVVVGYQPEDNILVNSLMISIDSLIFIMVYIWSIVQFIRIGRNIGFPDSLDHNSMIFHSGMGASLVFMTLYVLEIPSWINGNIYVYVLFYLALFIAVWALSRQVKIFTKAKKYVRQKGIFSSSDLINNLSGTEKEKGVCAQQLIIKMKEHKKIVEITRKTSIFVCMPVYEHIVRALSQASSLCDIEKSLKIMCREEIPTDVVTAIIQSIRQANTTGDKMSATEPKPEAPVKRTIVEPKPEALAANVGILAESRVREEKSREFMFLRYDIHLNLIGEASDSYKKSYIRLLQYILQGLLPASSALRTLLKDDKALLGITAKPEEETQKYDLAMDLLLLSKNEHFKMGFLRYRVRNYRYILLAEAFYLISVMTGKLDQVLLDRYCVSMKLCPKDQEVMTQYLSFAAAGELPKAEEVLLACKNRKLTETLWPLQKNIGVVQLYDTLPRFHVAVCATMSSGKSTFVNALLGKDYIPSKNEACTAKITSITDNDMLESVIGMKEDSSGQYSCFTHITPGVLEEWNHDNSISHIKLESNLDGIRSQKGTVVVHDTPGTNYSGDASHHDITINFLKSNQVELLIYLINAEHASTIDNQILLKQIKTEVMDDHTTGILFLLNKIDSFDTEKSDDIVSCVAEVKKELTEYGYQDPKVIPISANAARLFKMVLKRQELTKKELANFKNLFDLFYNEGLNLLSYTDEAWEHQVLQDSGAEYEIGGLKVKESQIMTALVRTGIPLVEKILDQKINI